MIRLFLVGLAMLVLAGCAPLAPREAASTSAGPVSATAYRLEGRVAVRTAEQQFSGGIVWSRQGDQQDILLRTPLGQGVAEVHMNPGGASLTDSEGKTYQAGSGEALLLKTMGLALPLSGLGHWLRGQPDMARVYVGVPDGQGGWASLEQDGWHIEYGAKDPSGLPLRLVARRADDLEIRLVVDAWSNP